MNLIQSAATPEQHDAITRNQCDACHWFVEWPSHAQPVPGKRLGTCQRHSPQYQQIKRENGTMKDTSKWPTTKSSDHCGDYRISVDLLAKIRAEREAKKSEEQTNTLPNPVIHGN